MTVKSLRRSLLVLGLATLALAPGAALAFGDGTSDGSPPAEEVVCDGLGGAAFGLCVAYCEANDCDLTPDSQACNVLRENYVRITGELGFPCDVTDPGDPGAS
jgi:hypothetical protein